MSFDTPAENRAFSEKFSFNFPLLSDASRAMAIAYGAADSPADGYARRIGVIIGPDGLIRDYQPKVSPKAYPAEALKLI